MVRIGDNSPVQIVYFLGISQGMHFSYLGGIEKRTIICTFLSYGYALKCIAASTGAAYQTGLKTHWRFRSRGSMSLQVKPQTAPDQNHWSRAKITCHYCPADYNPRGTISEILVRPDRNSPDQNSGDRPRLCDL